MAQLEKINKEAFNMIMEDLSKLINQFISNISGFNGCLLTEDGLIITEGRNLEVEQDSTIEELAAITASILSIAEQGILYYNSSKNLTQFTIETFNRKNPDEGLNILVFQIHPNVLFAFNYPRSVPKGLVTIELNHIIQQLQNCIQINEQLIMKSIETMI